jgi:hypothetical protein
MAVVWVGWDDAPRLGSLAFGQLGIYLRSCRLNLTKAFVRDLRAFLKEESQIKRDEIASRQLRVLAAYRRPRDKKLGPIAGIAGNFEMSA